MAGSYNHAVNDKGELLTPTEMAQIATENQGDAYETIQQMYGMIWFLADGDPEKVEKARIRWTMGCWDMSPMKHLRGPRG